MRTKQTLILILVVLGMLAALAIDVAPSLQAAISGLSSPDVDAAPGSPAVKHPGFMTVINVLRLAVIAYIGFVFVQGVYKIFFGGSGSESKQ